MAKKPTYEELEQRVNELVKKYAESNRIEKSLRDSEDVLPQSELEFSSTCVSLTQRRKTRGQETKKVHIRTESPNYQEAPCG